MLACIRGDEAMVGLLLERGADIRASEEIRGEGESPLSFAAKYSHPRVVQMLKQRDPSLTIRVDNRILEGHSHPL